MSIDHNRIKVADLERDEANKVLTTNSEGEIVFNTIYNGLNCEIEGQVLDARKGKELKELIDNINLSQLPVKTISTQPPSGIPADGEEWIIYTL